MSSQPTLTRLFAMLAFAGFAVYSATTFQLLQEGARVSGMVNTVAAVMVAVSGWIVAGPRIDARAIGSVFAVVQGLVVAVFLALAAGATVDTFRLGYKTRYDDLGEAMNGFFDYVAEGAADIAVPDLLVPMGVFSVVAGVVLSLLYRLMEARRNAR
jgi:drug/metabolite transporter (DMT)-like permease